MGDVDGTGNRSRRRTRNPWREVMPYGMTSRFQHVTARRAMQGDSIVKICSPVSGRGRTAGIKGIIFDCDGVLFDSRDVNKQYYNLIREGLGMAPMNRSEEEYVHMHTADKSVAHIVPPARMQEAARVRSSLSYRSLMPLMRPEEGLVPCLEMLRSRNLRMGVNTNRKDTMELVLELFDLEMFFFPVITAAKVVTPKPHPEGVHTILRAWRMRRDEVVYIGDSLLDQLTCQGAGVRFWAFKNENLTAEMHIPDFWTLLQWFAE